MQLLFRGPLPDNRADLIRSKLQTDWTVVIADDSAGADAYARALRQADATVAMSWSEATPEAPRLRLLQLPGAGFDEIDFSRVPAGAWVCNVFEHEIGIAEYVLCAMLEWCIGLRGMDARLRRGEWDGSFHAPRGAVFHGELMGKSLGLIGYGHINRAVAERAAAFGMRVRACSRTAKADAPIVGRVGPMQELPALLGASDFVVVGCPLDAATAGLIGTAELAAMKSDAVLINVARGPVVEERALFEACSRRTIAGAIIDVWYNYPDGSGVPTLPSDFPFLELVNVILSPHSSGLSEGLTERRCACIAANLDAIARGAEPVNVLRRPADAPPG